MTTETRTRLGKQLTYALRGVLISASVWSIAFMAMVARYILRATDSEIKTSIDSEYTIIGVTLLGFVTLSLVLGLIGWRKGKRVAIEYSEKSLSENSLTNMPGSIWVLLILAIVLVYMALQAVV